VAARAKARSLALKRERPGGRARAFCEPVKEDIDAEFIHGNGNHAEGRNGIDDEEDIRKLAHDGGDFLDRAHHARGGLICDERDGVEAARLERFANLLARIGCPHSTCSATAFLAALLRYVEPLVRKRAAHAVQHLAASRTRLRIDPSITPHALDVERKDGCFVRRELCSRG
jgi:hypothetical protein